MHDEGQVAPSSPCGIEYLASRRSLGHEVSAFECDPGAGILCAMLLEPLLFERARRDAGCFGALGTGNEMCAEFGLGKRFSTPPARHPDSLGAAELRFSRLFLCAHGMIVR